MKRLEREGRYRLVLNLAPLSPERARALRRKLTERIEKRRQQSDAA